MSEKEKIFITVAAGVGKEDVNREVTAETLSVLSSTEGINIDVIKKHKIEMVKAEAAKRIDAAYPQYKQINYGSAVLEVLNKENYAVKQGTTYSLTAEDRTSLGKAKTCRDFIYSIRSKSDELEILIDSKITIDALNAIDVSNDIYWS